jgi:3-hydroxyacyl-[acyl-carrier-protein] dehydratase
MSSALDTAAIMRWLPHRPPALWVDQLSDWEPFAFASGTKHVGVDNPCFNGHFPEAPITPGVWVVEALAQVGALLWNLSHETPGQVIWFTGIDACRFRQPVKPGDTLSLLVKGLRARGDYGRAQAIASVKGAMVCTAIISLAVPKKDQH